MKQLQLNPTEYPHLSQWEENHLIQTIESLSKAANPSKKEITQEDKQWAATMLEMDLATQSGAIWEDEQEDPKWKQTVENNKKFYQELEAQGKTLMSAEPEIPEEVIQEALKQQQRGRKMKEIFSLHKQGNETALDKIFLTETDPEVKEIARQLLLDLNGLPS